MMSEPFIGEIKLLACNYAPRGWAQCNGQLIAISQNQALFSLLGTYYGGDARTDFGLPELRGRVPIHAGRGPGLPYYQLGQRGGSEEVALTVAEMPSHTHTVKGYAKSNQISPLNHYLAQLFYDPTPTGSMSSDSISPTGGGLPHPNQQPYLVVGFCIALTGKYPSHN